MSNWPLRQRPLLDLFPPISPYSTGFLEVDGIHSLYWEQSGNPDGVPVILLHGGPGAGATPVHRRFFDPDHYRIIIFDQRGSGRSSPLGSLEKNNRFCLVDDIDRLRKHLGIERWHVFGGSWGSTLGLSYAQRHPDNCLSLILRSIYLGRQTEVDWFLYGIKMIFPEAWEHFIKPVPESDRADNLLNSYYDILTGPESQQQWDAAICWSLYEGSCCSLYPNYETISTEEQKRQALALARIEAHYFKHEIIPPEKDLLLGVDKIRHIPATIIQGRYDIICPIYTAHQLHLAWPEADYIVVPDGGHSALDPPVRSRLIEATENAKTIQI